MLFSSKPSRGLSGLSWLSGGILQANGTFRCSHDAVEFMSQGSYTALTASQLLAPAEVGGQQSE